ncbi:hypothetical protein BJ944DRAFT_260909 [Cunninghamella echinulata]|nr:hypothetical protein BJ944DRAFT_260909 [Cunninghamella echinulata]
MAAKYNTINPLPSPLPLTSENLKNHQIKKASSLKNKDTERYCQNLIMIPSNTTDTSSHYTAKRQKQRPSSTSAVISSNHKQINNNNRRSISIRSSQSQHNNANNNRKNSCMASPRLLPFPYHNDSLFLPTVEQHRHVRKVQSISSIHSQYLSTNSNISRPSTPMLPKRQLSAPSKLTKKKSNPSTSSSSSSSPTSSRPSSSISPFTTVIKSNHFSSTDIPVHTKLSSIHTTSTPTTTTSSSSSFANIHKKSPEFKKNKLVCRLWCKKVFKLVKKISIFH